MELLDASLARTDACGVLEGGQAACREVVGGELVLDVLGADVGVDA